MKNFDVLKDIWHQQVKMPRISPEDVIRTVRNTKKRLANKVLLEVFGMFIAISVLIYVWISTPFRMWTTHMGMVILLACCIYYLFAQLRDYRRINNDSLLTKMPGEYVEYLKQYKKDRYIFNTTKYRIYTISLGIGIALYFVEIFFIASVWITVIGLILTALWLWICYFILMRIYIRKEEARLGSMIDKLETLQKQFQENEN